MHQRNIAPMRLPEGFFDGVPENERGEHLQNSITMGTMLASQALQGCGDGVVPIIQETMKNLSDKEAKMMVMICAKVVLPALGAFVDSIDFSEVMEGRRDDEGIH